MTERESTMGMRLEELKCKLQETRDIALYYQWLAVRSGKRSIREIDYLIELNNTQKSSKQKLERRLELQKLIHSIASRFLNTSVADYETDIDNTLRDVGLFYEVDRAYLAIIGDDENSIHTMNQWNTNSITDQHLFHIDQKLDVQPSAAKLLKSGEPMAISNVSDLVDANLKSFIERQDIKSLIVVPMFRNKRLTGLFGFDMITDKYDWSDDDIISVQTIADILSNAIDRAQTTSERIKLEEQLNIRQRIDSLGTLAGGIAHDINNILVSIMGNIELAIIKSSDKNNEQAVFLERAFHSCEHAASLVREIRVFSHGASVEISGIDIYNTASEVFTTLEQTTNRMIDKRLEIKPDAFFVMANADLLHQVFLNLGCNAVQAIEERGVKAGDYISLSAERIDGDSSDEKFKDHIHIIFRDNGIGMTDKTMQKAFEPLFTTKRNSNNAGQGLGLSMVHHLITQNLGGTIDIESIHGEGTAFHIYLPATDCTITHEQFTPDECFDGSETVLVIDDDHAVAELATDTLEMYGYSTYSANDGIKGIELFERLTDTIDIIILDLIMPGLCGEEVILALKEIRADIPIIVISGKSEDDIANIPDSSAFLPKPFTVESLTAAVRHVLDN